MPNWFSLCLCLFCTFIRRNTEGERSRREQEKLRPSEVIIQDCEQTEFLQRCCVLHLIHLWDTSGRTPAKLWTALSSACNACLPACLPESCNIWQRSKWIQKGTAAQPQTAKLANRLNENSRSSQIQACTADAICYWIILPTGTVVFLVLWRNISATMKTYDLCLITETVQGCYSSVHFYELAR